MLSSEVIAVYQVTAYKKRDDRVPVQDFLDELPLKLREKTLRSLLLLQEFGPSLSVGMSRSMGDGSFKLRTTFGSDITRIFYFFVIGKQVVLTNGFIKKSQKTPKRELEKARIYKKDWEERYGNVDLE